MGIFSSGKKIINIIMIRKTSCFLSFPLYLLCFIIMSLLMLFWIIKEQINYGSFIVFTLCLIGVFTREGVEINKDSFKVFVSFLWYRKGKYINMTEKPYEICLNKVVEKTKVFSSKSIRESDSISSSYYKLQIVIDGKYLEVIKSRDYVKISSYAVLFADYFKLPITEKEIHIEFPTTGDYVEHLTSQKPIVRKIKNKVHPVKLR